MKAEELSWFYPFPHEVNGLNEEIRQVPISPRDYYQYGILSDDTRCLKNDYLFYASSMFEFYKINSTISVCGKKNEGHNDQLTRRYCAVVRRTVGHPIAPALTT
ncbi:hypothetical protein EVAR_79605_1 [Eumeta japonica]|uniref:Uncharacterized protein n=1 Tax=Eumeta variegata TaxID=151549 RepID=A0A4C1UEF8_EUMVA|nr:hypothetical protein EVAR_79605_1 [Eumeta japonica]